MDGGIVDNQPSTLSLRPSTLLKRQTLKLTVVETHSVSSTPLASLSIPTLLLARHEDASSLLAEVKHLPYTFNSNLKPLNPKPYT